MNKKKWIYMITSFFLMGCVKETDIDFEFDHNQLMLEGKIDISSGVEVYLTKTFSPLEVVDLDTLIVNQATITLYSGSDSIGEVVFNPDSSKYYFSATEHLSVGSSYWLDVKTPGYPYLYSSPVLLTNSNEISVDSYVLTNASDTTSTEKETELTFLIDDDGQVDNIYGFEWKVGSNGYYQTDIQFEIVDGVIMGCPASYEFGYLTDNCFNGYSNAAITLSATYYDTILVFIDNNLENEVRQPSDTTIINFKSYDELGQKYILSQSLNIFEEIDQGVPNVTYSNMSNGYGIFYSVSETIFTIASP